jgi:hypothetical protein
MANKKRIQGIGLLPESVYNILINNFTGQNLDRSILICFKIYRDYKYRNKLLSAPKELPWSYVVKILTSSYISIWKSLQVLRIFEKVSNYSVAAGRCYTYRFCREHWDSKEMVVRYSHTEDNRAYKELERQVINNLKCLKLEGQKSPEEIVVNLSPQYDKELSNRIEPNKRLYTNHKKNETVKIKGDIEAYRANKKSEMQDADLIALVNINNQNFSTSIKSNKRLNHTLTNVSNRALDSISFCSEKMCHIDLSCSQYAIFSNIVLQVISKHLDRPTLSEIEFVKDERGEVLESKILGLRENLERYTYEALRTIVNQKLSKSNFKNLNFPRYRMYNIINTSINTLMVINTICINNTLLRHYLHLVPPIRCRMITNKSISDLILFIDSSISGTLYEKIKEKQGYKDRNQAKKLCMQLFFGYFKEGNQVNDSGFPATFEIVNNFKGHYAYKLLAQKKNKEEIDYYILEEVAPELPVYLQQVEAEIFIDNILVKLYEQGLNVLSVHDSFLCPQSQYEKVLYIVYSELTKLLPFGFELKVKHPGAEQEEKIKYVNEAVSVSQIISEFMNYKTDSKRQERA